MDTTTRPINRRTTLGGLAIAGGALLAARVPGTLAATDATKAATFHDQMRKLWEDHITWTRLYIISAVADLPDLDQTTQRLLSNQDDIGAAAATVYGDDAGAALATLLRDHILGAAKVLTAAKAGVQADVDSASAEWYANGNDIAAFLHKANPDNWAEADLAAQMKMHLDMTLAEATAQLTGDFATSVAEYDKVHKHILGMADILSSGIVTQFPDKFA